MIIFYEVSRPSIYSNPIGHLRLTSFSERVLVQNSYKTEFDLHENERGFMWMTWLRTKIPFDTEAKVPLVLPNYIIRKTSIDLHRIVMYK